VLTRYACTHTPCDFPRCALKAVHGMLCTGFRSGRHGRGATKAATMQHPAAAAAAALSRGA
jgi:hypothetical protein